MNTPASILDIIEIVTPYLSELKTERPHFISSLPDNVEMEVKVPINSSGEVEYVIGTLRPLMVGGAEHRSEHHQIFPLKNGAHISKITFDDNDEVWMKVKSANSPFYTSKLLIPVIYRTGLKLRQGDDSYENKLAHTEENIPLAKFHKECVNFFFLYNGYIFSISLSLAWNEKGFLRREMEFEYEGISEAQSLPDRDEVGELFETIATQLIPQSFQRSISAATKYEALMNDASYCNAETRQR